VDDTLPDPEHLERLLTTARTLPALAPHAARLERLSQDYARGRELGHVPLTVALVGATGAGKSTLLNALAGQTLAREGEDRPTSTDATVFAPEGVALEELAGVGARVVRYTPGPRGLWGGQVFIDTPDLNSVATGHREVARAALERADLALVVMHRGSVAEATQADFLADFARRRSLVFLINFADELSPASREALRAQARRLASERYGLSPEAAPVFAISGRAAKQGLDPSGEFGALLFHLQSLATRAVAERVRRGNAEGSLEELRQHVRGALTETEATLARARTALNEGLGRAATGLREDFDTRLALAQGHLASEVRDQAAGRFWGPAAWGLRLSSLGAGGLGAATLLARRSLPVGLAVAATSTVLDAVRERTRARAAETTVVEPFEDDLAVEGAARAALTEARSLALAGGLAPETLGLPDLETLLAELKATRASAWRYTLTTAVAEAVATWWRTARWLLLPLLNLPLLVLLAHVGYRVVRAYVQGPLLGVDYFLNAAALFALLTGAGALLASASLAGTTRAVRRRGLARFGSLLDALAGRLGETVQDSLRAGREAARALLRPR
jgi:energy-coupling factor transporter ATP-binding protein EcfA2